MDRILVKGGRMIDPASGTDAVKDILVEDGRIARIGNGLSVDDAVQVNAEGMLVFPGLVDMHVHLREPGFEHNRKRYKKRSSGRFHHRGLHAKYQSRNRQPRQGGICIPQGRKGRLR